jgi:hypothetical protein
MYIKLCTLLDVLFLYNVLFLNPNKGHARCGNEKFFNKFTVSSHRWHNVNETICNLRLMSIILGKIYFLNWVIYNFSYYILNL